jgi:hypothetical protein
MQSAPLVLLRCNPTTVLGWAAIPEPIAPSARAFDLSDRIVSDSLMIWLLENLAE